MSGFVQMTTNDTGASESLFPFFTTMPISLLLQTSFSAGKRTSTFLKQTVSNTLKKYIKYLSYTNIQKEPL
jgi:hypothetical protein